MESGGAKRVKKTRRETSIKTNPQESPYDSAERFTEMGAG